MKKSILFCAITGLVVVAVNISVYAAGADTPTRKISANDPNDSVLLGVCTQALDKQFKPKYGSDATLVMYSKTLTGYNVSNHGGRGIRGSGFIKTGKLAKNPEVKFDCVVNSNAKKATKASYTVVNSTASQPTPTPTRRLNLGGTEPNDDKLANACGDAVKRALVPKYGNQFSFMYDTGNVIGYAVSNHGIEGVRGTAFLRDDKPNSNRKLPNLIYDCVVDSNANWTPTKITYQICNGTCPAVSK